MLFFTSDQHFQHNNIIKYCNRPFSNAAEMDEAIISRWNSVVGESDTVYVLGDFSMRVGAMTKNVGRLRGNKVLISGNHDACHSSRGKKASAMVEYYVACGFSHVCENAIVKLSNNINVILSHFPYATSYPSDHKFKKHLPVDSGMWLLHGHVHTQWDIKGRQINVGVDVRDFTPVSADQIVNIITNTKLDVDQSPPT